MWPRAVARWVLPDPDGSHDEGAVAGLGEPEGGELVPQLLVVMDGGGGVPAVESHAGVQPGGAGAAGGGSVLAAGDLVRQQELEEVGVGHFLLPGLDDPFGEGGGELAELEGAQVPFQVGADGIGHGHQRVLLLVVTVPLPGAGRRPAPGSGPQLPAGGRRAAVLGCLGGW